MQEDFKSIRIPLNYYDENAVYKVKEMTVKVNNVKCISKNEHHSQHRNIYSLSFSLVLPTHIYEFMKGKSVPENERDFRVYDDGFCKTITSNTLESVCKRYNEVLTHYRWLKEIDKAELQKVIFYSFENNFGEYKSDWNGNIFGHKSMIKFRFAVGYISFRNDKDELRYNVNKLLISKYNNSEFFKNKYVNFTEERMSFFERTQESFEKIIANINDFEKLLTEENINAIISKNRNMLGQ